MKNIIDSIKENLKLVIGTLVLGILLGWLVFYPSAANTKSETEIGAHEGHNHAADEPATWTCSMHPQIKQDKPGDCPICGMDLIPLSSMTADGDDVHPHEIMMSESAANLADIQTVVVTSGTANKSVFLQGKVQADERNIAELTARFGGRIEKLFVNFTGQNVRKGEKLATVYSPGLVTAQKELLEAIALKASHPALYTAAKGKLKLWDLTDEQISGIEERGEPKLYFDILSPISGTVTMRYVALGDYITEGIALFKVVDLKKVWVMFDAYERDLPWINKGDKIDFTIQSIPGKNFSGNVTYIDPFIDGITRVAKVRVEVANPSLSLKPEMYTAGVLQSHIAGSEHSVLIPKTSILWTGKRAVVYVKIKNRENPSFMFRQVVLGPEAGAFYVIKDGLEEGEEIAVNGVFKIDAAAQLQGLPSMMNPEGALANNEHNQDETMLSHSLETMEQEIGNFLVSSDFKKQLTQVYNTYLTLKEAFVTSDAQRVKNAADELNKALKNVDMALLKGDAHMAWMKHLVVLEKTTNAIRNLLDIEKQRIEFAPFNIAFYKSIKAFGLNEVTTYYQYCPMADKDKGAYWFSDSEEIRNPYFGDSMLGCGENRETIK